MSGLKSNQCVFSSYRTFSLIGIGNQDSKGRLTKSRFHQNWIAVLGLLLMKY